MSWYGRGVTDAQVRLRRRPRTGQTDREFIEWMGREIDRHLGTEPEPGPVPSPTGREPRLVWTSRLQGSYARMKAEAEAGEDTLGATWFNLIVNNAFADRYGDSGLWATLAYQMTGDSSFVPHAWRQIEAMLASALDDDNNTRELAMERVLLLDWLWPGLTESQREQMFEALDRMFTNGLEPAVRLNDSDQCTGVYFGLLFYAKAFWDVHPPAAAFFERAGVGGVDATSVDLKTTMRNAVAWFLQAAAGGEWLESSDYNLGTVRLLLLGWAGARTVLGAEHFPEIAAWVPSAALRYPLMATEDLEQSLQWGDEQHPRELVGWKWSSTAMMFDHPVARRFVYDLVDKLGAVGSYTAEPTVSRAFCLFDPYGPQEALESPLLDARGQGLVAARSPHASLLGVHMPPTPTASSVDHLVNYFGDLQLYRPQAGWALTHPIMYGGYGNNGMAENGMLLRGWGAPKECRNCVVYTGSDWVYVAGTAGGTVLASKFYQPPPTWLHEWSRQVLWIQGAAVDTLVVFDRTHLDDPLQLAGFSKYADADEKKMREHPLRLWRWHCPVRPALSGQTASWSIGEEHRRITWLRADLVPTITDQAVAWANQNMVPSERKFHLDLTPGDDPGLAQLVPVPEGTAGPDEWAVRASSSFSVPTPRTPRTAASFETLVTVLEFGDPSAFSTISLHRDDAAYALAVELAHGGRPTWAVLCNTCPGPRLPTYGGQSAYHPDIPGLLEPVRWGDYPLPAVGARLWGMETPTGVPTVEP